MKTSMKILIGYDGSACANEALRDLDRAGLPSEADVRILTVAETWAPQPLEFAQEIESVDEGNDTIETIILKESRNTMTEAGRVAEIAARRVRERFPGWHVEGLVNSDSPALGILRMADLWKPDLIIVGSHGRSAVERVLIGSVSQKVLTEAHSSVRIVREHPRIDGSPLRIVVGTDGTPDAKAAVRVVASRNWPAGSAVRVIAAHDTLGTAVPPLGSYMNLSLHEAVARHHEWLVEAVESATQQLREAGINAAGEVLDAKPVQALLHEAKEWGADSIFVGARGHGFFDRFLLGSVSSALATRAHCSVEVVRNGVG
jgi:nucleotide-binding universal stress UspA family protein